MPIRISAKRAAKLMKYARTSGIFDKPLRPLIRPERSQDGLIPTAGAILQKLEQLGARFAANHKRNRQLVYESIGDCAAVIAMLEQEPSLKADTMERLIELRKQQDKTTKFDLYTELIVIATHNDGEDRGLANKRAHVILHLLRKGVDPSQISQEVKKRGLEKTYRASVPKSAREPKTPEKGKHDETRATFSARIAILEKAKLLKECSVGKSVMCEVHRTGKGSSDFEITQVTVRRPKVESILDEDWAA